VCGLIFGCYAAAVAHFHLELVTTLLWLPLVGFVAFLFVRLGRGIYPSTFNTDIYRTQASVLNSRRFRLYGMPISHFVEKVRWCMDIMKCPYEETTAGGLLTMFFRGRSVPFLLDRESCSVIGNSDEILMYLQGVFVPSLLASLPPSEEDPAAAEKRQAIKKLFERTSEILSFEKELNTFGHAIQGWAYSYHLALFTNPNPSVTLIAWGGEEPMVSALERMILKVCYPVFKLALNVIFELNDMKLRAERLAVIHALLDKVDAMLVRQKEMRVARRPRPRSRSPKGKSAVAVADDEEESETFLFGDHISYADITFCALVAPLVGYSIVFPKDGSESLYAAGRFRSFTTHPGKSVGYDVLKDVQAPVADLEAEILGRPCGRYIMNMYKNHRKTPLI
jgi:glutathione S-transferase